MYSWLTQSMSILSDTRAWQFEITNSIMLLYFPITKRSVLILFHNRIVDTCGDVTCEAIYILPRVSFSFPANCVGPVGRRPSRRTEVLAGIAQQHKPPLRLPVLCLLFSVAESLRVTSGLRCNISSHCVCWVVFVTAITVSAALMSTSADFNVTVTDQENRDT